MKKLLLAVIVLVPLLAQAQDAVEFEKYFADRTMRIDVFHTGDAKEEMFTIDRVIQEGPWAGNPLPPDRAVRTGTLPAAGERRRLRHPGLQQGLRQLFRRIQDHRTGGERGQEDLFRIPAHPLSEKQGPRRGAAARPREPAAAHLQPRDRPGRHVHRPRKACRRRPGDRAGEERAAGDQGRPGRPRRGLHATASGRNSSKDLARFSDAFFSQEPYKTYQDRFNVTGLFKPSAESGCDEPELRLVQEHGAGRARSTPSARSATC